jgi:hypothetical protein
MDKSIRLNLKPVDREIEKARLKIGNFLKSHGFSDETVNTQAMITRELINSGIKCGRSTSSEDEITLNIFIDENTITFEVKNPVDDSCFDRIKELDKTIQFIRGYQDPFEPYLIKKREIDENPPTNHGNGLGLARVAYEGGAILDFFVDEDNVMSLYAIRNLG